jgi:uncharacterized surface protein with fasciclin (FAS1) repeats
MRSTILSCLFLAGSALAQGDIVSLLESQDDLSTLLQLVGLVDGLADMLAEASNITIFAPTNEAFENVPEHSIEAGILENGESDLEAVAALLSNHVIQGNYRAEDASDVPVFVQSLLQNQPPYSNITGGAYSAIVTNDDDVVVISGDQTISTVTEAVSVALLFFSTPD